jgi:type I restriction enzyme S subunit
MTRGEMKQLRRVVRRITTKTESLDLRYVGLENIESATGRFIDADSDVGEGSATEFAVGDVLFGKLRPYLAKAWLATFPGRCTTEALVLRAASDLIPRFLKWLMLNPLFIDAVDGSTYGSKMPRAEWDFIGRVGVYVPPVEVQRRIADFLDRKTAAIDALIAKQEQLLALLAEKRQALITQAVTKGLDPNVPMKDSGVEWIGAIPALWRVARIRHVAKLESGHTPSRQHPEWWIPDECTIPWVSLADVWKLRDGVTEYISDTTEKISEAGLANSSARLLPAKTVILSRTASVGFSAIISVPMATTQDFVNWICGPSVLPEYLLYVLRAMKPEFARLTQGSVHRTIYMPDVARLVMPVPSLGEQQRIVTHVRSELRRLDAISQRVQAMIEKLREYRQALITAAVTGQLEVTPITHSERPPSPQAEAV